MTTNNKLEPLKQVTRWIQLGAIILMLGMHSPLSLAEAMDANLNMAKRLIDEVASGLGSLKQGDVSTYNRLSAKLTKAADKLKATETKQNSEFLPLVKRWDGLQASMAETAASWQVQNASASAQAGQGSQAASVLAATQSSANAAGSINLDAIMAKYQPKNRPKLAANASPDEARAWATAMLDLKNDQLQSDVQTIKTAASNGSASRGDAERVHRWITGDFQRQIDDELSGQVQMRENQIRGSLDLAKRVSAISLSDRSKVYNFGRGENGERNEKELTTGLQAAAVSLALREVLGTSSNANLGQQIQQLSSAREHMQKIRAEAIPAAAEFAKMPKKKKKVTPDFLAPVAQKFWLGGTLVGESDKKGSIWINSRDVGDVTHNGKIWVNNNQRGSIEPDGEVWFDGNFVGTLEDNGKVWRRGNQVGSIDKSGKVWVNNGSTGVIEPFEGEWKRAAILYFFRDFFTAG